MHVIFSFADGSWYYFSHKGNLSRMRSCFLMQSRKSRKIRNANAAEKSVNRACWKSHMSIIAYSLVYTATVCRLTIGDYLTFVCGSIIANYRNSTFSSLKREPFNNIFFSCFYRKLLGKDLKEFYAITRYYQRCYWNAGRCFVFTVGQSIREIFYNV